MIILVLNCGSSSLKYQVLDMKNENEYALLAKGLVERIGLEMGEITHRPADKDKHVISKPIPDHTEGIKSVLDLLVDAEQGVLKSLGEINAVGHRVAHGGDLFSSSAVIHSEVIEGIQKCCELAPLHNPANLLGIMAVRSLMPEIPQVAVFDTSFHQTMPEHAYMYAIPYEYYVRDKVRRYGFHGTSHKFVAEKSAKLAGLDFNNSKIITCHLGNGGSVTAIDIKDGNCVRLFKGDYSTAEKVAESAYDTANYFKECGAQWLHMVDLDGAKDAKLINSDLIIDVAKTSGLNVEVGGGIRDMAAIEHYLNNGIQRVILGSAAVKNQQLVIDAVKNDKIFIVDDNLLTRSGARIGESAEYLANLFR